VTSHLFSRRQRLIDDVVAEEDARLLADHGTVRLVAGGDDRPINVNTGEEYDSQPPPEDRTPMQTTLDEIFDNADKDAITALETATSSLAWLELIVDIPKELRHNLPKLLADLQVLIHDERRLRL